MMSQSYLEYRNDRGVQRFPLAEEPITVGRHRGNLLVLDDQGVSLYHCVILPKPWGYQVCNLLRRLGTLVNSQAVDSAVLQDGDVLSIGGQLLVYNGSIEQAEAQAQAQAQTPSPESMSDVGHPVAPSQPPTPTPTSPPAPTQPAPQTAPQPASTAPSEPTDETSPDQAEPNETPLLIESDEPSSANRPVHAAASPSAASPPESAPSNGEPAAPQLQEVTPARRRSYAYTGEEEDDGGALAMPTDEGVGGLVPAADLDTSLDTSAGSLAGSAMASAAGASQGTTFVTSSGGPGEGGGSLEALANDPTLWTEEPPEKPEQATAGVSLLERLIDPEFQQPFADSEMELINFKRVVVIPPEKHKETVAAVMLLKKLLRACSVCGATELRVLKNSGAKTPHRLILRIHGRLTEAGVLDHGKTRLIKGVINTLSGVAAGQTDNAGNGTFSARLPGRQVYYLVKSPDRFEGTELFVRVLDKQRVPMHLKDVGLAPTVLKPIQSTLSGEGGLLLLAGPPNAGRTTSLYAMLRAFDVHQHRIVTIEDEPIYAVDGITQVPVDHSKDLHLAKLMKLAIRQKRPQVMLLSELDDERAAQQAVKAAANGTLVLAEFRARDAAEAMLRLAVRSGPMLGMLTDALKLVVAQRMVRQLCPHCKVETPVKPEQRQRYGKPFQGLDRIYSQWSCDKCLGIGYQGMLPIVETVHPSLELMARIEQGVPLATLRQSLRQAQPRGLWQAGGEAIAAGETAIAEVERVLSAVPM